MPTAAQRDEYRKIARHLSRRGQPLPARHRCGDIYALVVARFKEIGVNSTSMLSGHGVGGWWHRQEPVIARGNPMPLEEGMVIAVEPHVDHC
jgi:Xaa-Pro aminopeptidase